jgi:hypothetical protein
MRQAGGRSKRKQAGAPFLLARGGELVYVPRRDGGDPQAIEAPGAVIECRAPAGDGTLFLAFEALSLSRQRLHWKAAE